jgi:hypothetical protein
MLTYPSRFRTKRISGSNAATRTRTANQQMIPKIDMVIGSWYLDELGNKTREITAHD